MRSLQRRLLVGLCWVLAASFVVGAVTKFLPGETFFGPPYAVKFVEWGYPSWFRFVVGAGELTGAVLLVTPRGRVLGTAVLGVILIGAVITHLVNQDPLAQSIAAPVVLLLTGIAAWAFRPAGPRGYRRRREDPASRPALLAPAPGPAARRRVPSADIVGRDARSDRNG